MRNALDLQVVVGLRAVVEEQHRAPAAGEELLQREDLAAIAQRIAREQTQFRHRVEHDAGRLDLVHFGEDRLRGFAELDLGRVKDGIALVGLEIPLGGNDFADLHAREVPAMRGGDRAQFFLGLGKGDVEHRFAAGCSGAQELQCQRRLARTRNAFDDIKAVGRQASVQDVVETRDAGIEESGRRGDVLHFAFLRSEVAAGDDTGRAATSSACFRRSACKSIVSSRLCMSGDHLHGVDGDISPALRRRKRRSPLHLRSSQRIMLTTTETRSPVVIGK